MDFIIIVDVIFSVHKTSPGSKNWGLDVTEKNDKGIFNQRAYLYTPTVSFIESRNTHTNCCIQYTYGIQEIIPNYH